MALFSQYGIMNHLEIDPAKGSEPKSEEVTQEEHIENDTQSHVSNNCEDIEIMEVSHNRSFVKSH